MKVPSHVLPIIVFSQFSGTSVWFAVNVILPDLPGLSLNVSAISDLTAVIQFGFISGTMLYAVFMIADKFSPVLVFMLSSILSGLFNGSILWISDVNLLMAARFFTGFFLAGIYPVGMKIATDWHKSSLGNALGFLVGALVLGKAFPYAIKYLSFGLPWQTVIIATSVLSFFGGLLMYLGLGDGPNRLKASTFKLKALYKAFQLPNFRGAALGYFGHMWELYAFWAFLPLFIKYYNTYNQTAIDVPGWSFIIIAVGSIGCAFGGIISNKFGSKFVAFLSLAISGVICLSSFLLAYFPVMLFLLVLMVWGFFVIMDSPQFSTLVANSAPTEYKGSALTLVNSIGFGITIISIKLLDYLEFMGINSFVFLGIGPVIGLFFTSKIHSR